MGNSVYYGIYSKECNNDKVLPYLSMNPGDGITNKLFINKKTEKEFFDILRKYSIEKEKSIKEDNGYLYWNRCYIIKYYEDYFNFYNEVNIVLPEDITECDFNNYILIFWVA